MQSLANNPLNETCAASKPTILKKLSIQSELLRVVQSRARTRVLQAPLVSESAVPSLPLEPYAQTLSSHRTRHPNFLKVPIVQWPSPARRRLPTWWPSVEAHLLLYTLLLEIRTTARSHQTSSSSLFSRPQSPRAAASSTPFLKSSNPPPLLHPRSKSSTAGLLTVHTSCRYLLNNLHVIHLSTRPWLIASKRSTTTLRGRTACLVCGLEIHGRMTLITFMRWAWRPSPRCTISTGISVPTATLRRTQGTLLCLLIARRFLRTNFPTSLPERQ